MLLIFIILTSRVDLSQKLLPLAARPSGFCFFNCRGAFEAPIGPLWLKGPVMSVLILDDLG